MKTDEKILMTLDAAARLLSLSVWTLRAWAQRGQISTIKVGARRMIRADVVHQIAERGLS